MIPTPDRSSPIPTALNTRGFGMNCQLCLEFLGPSVRELVLLL